MLLVLYGSDLLLLGSLVMAYPHHLDDVEAEAQCDETEDKGKEQLLVAVGKGLHIGGKPVKTGGLGELAPCRDFFFIAFLVLGVILVRHLVPENHFLPSHIYDVLIVRLGLLLYILVQQGAPLGDEQAMRIVLAPRDTLQFAGGDKLTGEDIRAALDALPPVVGELHLVLVEPYGVTEDAEDGTGSHDVVVEAFLLQGVVLGKSCLIYQIHGLGHGVVDVLVIRGKGEEKMMETLHMALCLYIKGLVHGRTLDKDRDIAVQHIDLLLGIDNHAAGCPDAAQADDDAAQKEETADDADELDFVL